MTKASYFYNSLICWWIEFSLKFEGFPVQNVKVDQALEPGTRVTVEMGTNRNLDGGQQNLSNEGKIMLVQ